MLLRGLELKYPGGFRWASTRELYTGEEMRACAVCDVICDVVCVHGATEQRSNGVLASNEFSLWRTARKKTGRYGFEMDFSGILTL